MNILLTNDDGYSALGINVVYDILKKYGNVYIVAPKKSMSAMSVSITLRKGFEVSQIKENIYAVDGTPADCVSFGLSYLGIKFDLVVSGCNHGFNISYDTLFSGTVGAALMSLTYEIPSIALSCENNFDILNKHLDEVMKFIFDNRLLSSDYLLNVNFPLGESIKGIKISELYYRKDNNYFVKENDKYYAYRNLDQGEYPLNSDCYLVYNGYVSITPLNKTLYCDCIKKKLCQIK